MYQCRCGNISITVNSESPSKADWKFVELKDIQVQWPFLQTSASKIVNSVQWDYVFCVLCSHWLVGKKANSSEALINMQFFSQSDALDPKSTTLERFTFLPESVSSGAGDGVIGNFEQLKEIEIQFLDSEKKKTITQIALLEEQEWKKYEKLKMQCEIQIAELEMLLKSAEKAMGNLSTENLPASPFQQETMIMSPDDGFAQVDEEDPPREWREVDPQNTDLTEADVFEMEGSDEGLPPRNSSFDKEQSSRGVLSEKETMVTKPVNFGSGVTKVDSSFMLSKSQPRAIPTLSTAYGRTLPNCEYTEDGEEGNVAKAIEILARSIVNDGTELFSAPVPSALSDNKEQ